MSGGREQDRSRRPQPLPPEVRQVQQAQANVMNELMQAKLLRAVDVRAAARGSARSTSGSTTSTSSSARARCGSTSPSTSATRFGRTCSATSATCSAPTAHSPAMLFYLDNLQSATPNRAGRSLTPEMQQRLQRPAPHARSSASSCCRGCSRRSSSSKRPQRGLNENYARELMELHTLGVDGGYTQKDVIEVARVAHGLDDRSAAAGRRVRLPPADARHRRRRRSSACTFPAGGGQDEGERVLDMLAKHPSTAHHIAYRARAAVRRRRAAGGARRSRREDVPRHQGRPARGHAHDHHVAGVLRRRRVSREGEDAARVRRLGRARDGRDGRQRAAAGRARCAISACRSTAAQPPTGYSMTADAWVNTGALLSRMNFALQLVERRHACSRGRTRPAAADRRRRSGAPASRGLGAQAAARGRRQDRARGRCRSTCATLAPDTSERRGQPSIDVAARAASASDAHATDARARRDAAAARRADARLAGVPDESHAVRR